MRIEQQSKNVYQKKPDKVEAHILKIIERFFETNKEAIEGTRENIINETIKRIKLDTINSIRGIVVEELSTVSADNIMDQIDQRIEDVIMGIYQQSYDLPIINTYEHIININSETNTVTLPTEYTLKSGIDTVDLFINGLIHKDFSLIVNSDGKTNGIQLSGSDVFEVDDIVYVKITILFRNSGSEG